MAITRHANTEEFTVVFCNNDILHRCDFLEIARLVFFVFDWETASSLYCCTQTRRKCVLNMLPGFEPSPSIPGSILFARK